MYKNGAVLCNNYVNAYKTSDKFHSECFPDGSIFSKHKIDRMR